MWDDPETAGYVTVEGGRIWWRANGIDKGDRAALICITGGPGMSHHYMVPFLRLADERPVILYDQLDTGNADRPNDPGNWRVDRFTDEIARLREALGLDRVVLLGNSWGAVVALECVLSDRAAGIEGLILSSPFISVGRWMADAAGLVAALPKGLRDAIDEAERTGDHGAQGYADATREYSRRHICRTDPRPDFVLKSFSIFGEAVYVGINGPSEFNISGLLGDYDREADLPRVGVPVLITCGEHDGARPDTCRHFASLMADAEVAEFAGASHFTFAETPDDYISTVRDFMRRKRL